MKSDSKTIEQFKKLYFEEFGETLSDQEAFERFSSLINVLRIICYPDQFPSLDIADEYANVRTQTK